MQVSIIVPVYNKIEVIFQCLKLNIEHAFQPCEWIIIDNNSDSATKTGLVDLQKIAHQLGHEWIIVTETENTGVAKAWNKGISMSKGQFICILNNDCVMMPNWDLALINSTLDLKSPLIAEPEDFTSHYALSDFLSKEKGWPVLLKRNHTRVRKGYFSGIVLFGKKSLFDTLGPFDDHFWLSMEDMDYIYRARRAGFETGITGDCIAYHFSSLTRKSVSHSEDANQNWFFGKWGWKYCDREGIKTNKWIKSWQKRTWKYFQVMSTWEMNIDRLR